MLNTKKRIKHFATGPNKNFKTYLQFKSFSELETSSRRKFKSSKNKCFCTNVTSLQNKGSISLVDKHASS